MTEHYVFKSLTNAIPVAGVPFDFLKFLLVFFGVFYTMKAVIPFYITVLVCLVFYFAAMVLTRIDSQWFVALQVMLKHYTDHLIKRVMYVP